MSSYADRLQPVTTGVAAALIGYTGTFAVVLAGLQGVGASPAQAASGLLALCAVAGLISIWTSWRYRIPLTMAWSTPGAAILAGAGGIAGEWPTAVGAFVVAGALTVVTGVWPVLGRLVSAIPVHIAQAMLAGVLFELCLVPVLALRTHLAYVAPVVAVWIVAMVFMRRWATTLAFGAAGAVVVFLVVREGGLDGPWWPQLVATVPQFDLPALVGLAVPLYIVTMAAQNVPGVAILGSYGFRVPWRGTVTLTGLGTMIAAPFGGHAVNLAAISGALPASEEAHPDPRRRWVSSCAFGISYLLLAVVTTALINLLSAAPEELVGTVAGLGLLGTFASALAGAFAGKENGAPASSDRIASAVTLLVAASGVAIAGVSAAFWALIAGLVVHLAFRVRAESARTPGERARRTRQVG